MEENRIYYKELPCYQSAKEKEKRRVYSEPYFDLGELPEGALRPSCMINQISNI